MSLISFKIEDRGVVIMEYKDRPLIQAMLQFKKTNPVSFHVPGHKYGRLSRLPIEIRNALC